MTASNTPTEPKAVTWTKLPIIGLDSFRCEVRVTKDGRAIGEDGEPLPFDIRPNECGEDGIWLLGRVPLCETHARETARLMDDDIEDILAAWKAECL